VSAHASIIPLAAAVTVPTVTVTLVTVLMVTLPTVTVAIAAMKPASSRHMQRTDLALVNPENPVLIQKRYPYTGNLNSKMSGDSKNTFFHCGDLFAPSERAIACLRCLFQDMNYSNDIALTPISKYLYGSKQVPSYDPSWGAATCAQEMMQGRQTAELS